MGTKSISTNISETVNQNLPVSQQDVTNPINLLNASGVRLNSSDSTQSGNFTTTTLDGGAIASAFDFGNFAISKFADLTTQLNTQTAAQNSAAVAAAVSSASGQEAAKATDWMQNPKILAAAVAVAIAYMYFRK